MTNKLLDKNYLRIPTKNKIPLRKDWSLPVNQYYKEPLTISQLLKDYGEYGIRLGLFIRKDYHLGVLYFRNSEIAANLFLETSYTLTENGFYYFCLLKELPPNSLLKNLQGERLGNFYGSGKLIIGAGSKINNFTYLWVQKKQDFLTFDSFKEFLNYLLDFNLGLEIQGKVEFNSQQQEWFCPTKLSARWKKRNFQLAKIKKAKELKKTKKTDIIAWKKCLFCRVRYKYEDKHLLRCSTNKKVRCRECHRKINSKRLARHFNKIHSYHEQ